MKGESKMEILSPQKISQVEEIIQYEFKKKSLLERAMVHKSFCYEISRSTAHNETYEFLGDAVVNLVAAEILLATYPTSEEGDLSKRRASVVNLQTLADVAKELNLGKFLVMGKGEAQMGGADKPRILASAFEALCGAIYLDGGYQEAREFVKRLLGPKTEGLTDETAFAADFKTRLQELAQKEFRRTPTYELVHEEGPSHDKTFTVAVRIGDYVRAMGKGKSKKVAEQMAAKKVIEDRELLKEAAVSVNVVPQANSKPESHREE